MMAQRSKPKVSSPQRAAKVQRGSKTKPAAATVPSAAPERHLSFAEQMTKRLAQFVEHTMQSAGSELLSQSYPVRRQLLLDLANVQGEVRVQWFWRKWASKLWPEKPGDLIRIGDELRRIWRMDSAERLNSVTWWIEDAESHLPPDWLANEILNGWLSWRPSDGQQWLYRTRQLKREQEAQQDISERWATAVFAEERGYEHSQWVLPGGYVPFVCWLPGRTLVPDTRGLHPLLIQGVFEHWGHFKVCSNPNCASPYFIAKRKDQTVCDAEICKAEKQRQHALKWWRDNRAKKSQKKATSKPKEKGIENNVTRKTR